MDRQVLLRKIMGAGDEIRRLGQDVAALQSVDIVGYPENYSALSQKALINAEFIVRRLRELVYGTSNVSWEELMRHSAEKLDIAVHCDDNGIVEIILPCLVPGRKKKPIGFIEVPLYAELEKFVADKFLLEQPFERFNHCTISITHVYNEALLGKGRRRDHDNIEVKGIVDVINRFLLNDDTGILCNVYHNSVLSDTDCTRIHIMGKELFPPWVLGQLDTAYLPLQN